MRFLLIFSAFLLVKGSSSSLSPCPEPFYLVGDSCLLIDNVFRGSWSDMKDICNSIGGTLANIYDANVLYDISNYLKVHAMDNISYWVDAGDGHTEGTWVWVDINYYVNMAPPVWGQLNGIQPDGGEDQNCGALEMRDFYYMHDVPCADSMYGVICMPDTDGASTSILKNVSNECPPPYERIGDKCIEVIVEEEYTWYEAREVCTGINRHIAKIDDANLLGDIYKNLEEKGVYPNLWIGGSDEVIEGTWVWDDQTIVKMGTPFWYVANELTQEPSDDRLGNCLVLSNDCLYHFDDIDCTMKAGVLCQYDE